MPASSEILISYQRPGPVHYFRHALRLQAWKRNTCTATGRARARTHCDVQQDTDSKDEQAAPPVPKGHTASACQIVLLIADEDYRPDDHQQGQCSRGGHNAPNTGFAEYRFNVHGFLLHL